MVSLRSFLKNDLIQNYSIEEIVEKYQEWANQDTYMILTKWNPEKQKNDVYAVKCSKRGNDVYKIRVKRKFQGVGELSENIVFFNPKDRKKNKKTRSLFVTLTYDTKLKSYKDAWKNIGSEFNIFMTKIRKKHGRISSCRVFESFQNGYPHIHCILLFEKEFNVIKDQKGNFRIREKQDFEEAWHSHVDVRAVDSLRRGLNYLKKYLLKGIDIENTDSKTLITLALCWVFRKRAFSVSGSFRRKLSDLIRYLHNSNKKLVQTTLKGEIIPEEPFCLLGFVPAEVILIKKDIWFTKLNTEQIDALNKYLEKKKRWY